MGDVFWYFLLGLAGGWCLSLFTVLATVYTHKLTRCPRCGAYR